MVQRQRQQKRYILFFFVFSKTFWLMWVNFVCFFKKNYQNFTVLGSQRTNGLLVTIVKFHISLSKIKMTV